MRLPEKNAGDTGIANDVDPRDQTDAEVIDLAQRNAFPAVSRPAGKSDALGLVAGIALVAGLGLVTLWSMNSARVAPPEGIGGQQAPVEAAPAVPPQAVTPVAPAAAMAAPRPARIRPRSRFWPRSPSRVSPPIHMPIQPWSSMRAIRPRRSP
ncbi:hypothetical protein [Erythrobacter aureus]|uniref:hypothetical protein n=1 Tax=Erythrobacter aureus TaxID=2182384 RepID=UPI00350E48F6